MTTPVPFTLPPDTRTVGSGNPPADMNQVIAAHLAQMAGYNVLSTAYGADPTGAADSTAAFLAAANALPATGGTVIVPPGTCPQAQRAAVSGTATVNQYLRAATTTAGGFSGFTFAVVISVNPVAVTF